MPAHNDKNLATHMSLHIAKLEEENKQLKKQVQQLEQSIESSTPVHLFSLKNFSQYGTDNTFWTSPIFSNHHHGYKMQVGVFIVKLSMGIVIRILRGEYDKYLIWPFHGSVTVTLIGENNNLLTCTQLCNENSIIRGEEGNIKCVHLILGVHKSLIHKYLINDKLYIRVSDICILAPE